MGGGAKGERSTGGGILSTVESERLRGRKGEMAGEGSRLFCSARRERKEKKERKKPSGEEENLCIAPGAIIRQSDPPGPSPRRPLDDLETFLNNRALVVSSTYPAAACRLRGCVSGRRFVGRTDTSHDRQATRMRR